jgi:type VI secretion system protein ImpL
MTASAAPQLAAMLPYLVVLLALVAIALMFLSIRHAREAKANGGGSRGGAMLGPPEAEPMAPGPPRSLPQSIRLASVQLRRLVSGGGGGGIYEVPWVVAVGAGGADLDRLLPDRLPWPPDLAGAHQAILGQVGRLSFCRAGAVLSFDDGLLDSPGWRQRWHSLIRALETCRPERPIDGLVVAIGAAELQGLPEGQDRLVARGEQLYQLIWSVQRVTGWRIPVYLLIRGCAALTGFADWALALPPAARQQVLGWSVPYAVDTVFEPRWVDEGVAQMARQLSAAQLLLMMPEPELEVAEGLLLFPGEAQRLAAPLSVLLTSMLRTSAYHEAFMFRGFFFAGSVPGAAAPAGRADGSLAIDPVRVITEAPGARDEAFAEALFTQKVFPEHRLAEPAYGETTRRHRQIRIAQAVLAVLALLCLIGVMYIRRVDTDYLPPVATLLSQIDQEVGTRVMGGADRNPGPAGRQRIQDVALRLLNSMAAIQLNRVDTIAAPTSLATSANARVEQAIAAGYDVAVLRAAYYALTGKSGLAALLDPAPPPGAPAPTANEALATTVDNVVQYDKYIRVYQGITAQPSIGEVSALMSYALDVQLPAGFTTDYQLYEGALSNARMPPIQTSDVQPAVEGILQDRYDAVINDTYQGDQLVAAVKKLVSVAGNLSTPPQPPAVDAGRAVLAETRTTLDTIAGLLVPPNYDWLSSKPGSAVSSSVLDRLGGVQVVRTGFIDGLRARGLQAQTDTRNWLLHATAFDRAPVLASGEGATLSPSMDATRSLLNDLFSQGFMQTVAAAGAPAIPAAGTRINWDMQSLRQGEGIAESFLAFAPREDATLPQSIPGVVRPVAGAAAAANIGFFVRLAARPTAVLPNGGSRAMLQDVTGLASALPILTNLRNALRQAGATAEAGSLDQLVATQAIGFLRQLYDNLVSAAPYRLADPSLSFWQGSPPLAEPAFGASSPTDLASTLPPRRDFVETLARDYAAPLVAYLRDPGTTRSGLASGLVAAWQSILDTLDRYHRSDPSNSSRSTWTRSICPIAVNRSPAVAAATTLPSSSRV